MARIVASLILDPTLQLYDQLAIKVAHRINSFGVLETMADVMLMRGVLEHIQSDNGAAEVLAFFDVVCLRTGADLILARDRFSANDPKPTSNVME